MRAEMHRLPQIALKRFKNKLRDTGTLAIFRDHNLPFDAMLLYGGANVLPQAALVLVVTMEITDFPDSLNILLSLILRGHGKQWAAHVGLSFLWERPVWVLKGRLRRTLLNRRLFLRQV